MLRCATRPLASVMITHPHPAEIAAVQSVEKTGPLTAAERMQRSRKRRKSGLFCLTLELRMTEVEALVRCGRIKPEDRNSPGAIRNALYSVLENFVLSTAPLPATGPETGAPVMARPLIKR